MFWFSFLFLCVISWFITGQPPKPKGSEPPKPTPGIGERTVMLVLMTPILWLVSVGVASCTGPRTTHADEAKKEGGLSHSYALMLCQTAVKSALVDPDSASVPYVESVGGGDEFYFAWGASTRTIKSKNRMGLEVASSASCTINGKTAEVTSLTVNGKTIR
jgi:hypothetical protein